MESCIKMMPYLKFRHSISTSHCLAGFQTWNIFTISSFITLRDTKVKFLCSVASPNMSGAQSHWVTYAGNDEEAWKSIGLARSLCRVHSRRRTAVIVADDKVSRDVRHQLQSEFDVVHFHPASGFLDTNGILKDLPFGTIAKLHLPEKFRHYVFLDCNCVVVKNCDWLFHEAEDGVQLVETQNHSQLQRMAVVMVKGLKKRMKGEVSFEKLVVSYEKGEEVEESWMRNYCIQMDLNCAHPFPLPKDQVSIICFTGGHPIEFKGKIDNLPNNEIRDVLELWRSLEIDRSTTGARRDEDLSDSIAIIGMGCRYPGANSLAEFWQLLEHGIEGIRKVPDFRWTKEQAVIQMENTRITEAGFLSCPIDEFDSKFFNVNAADLSYLDPQQRLALRVVWEALEHGCIDPLSLKSSLTGVFGGWWRNDYKEMLQQLGSHELDFLRGYMGNALGSLTARISHFFDLLGPALSTESGCSTSIAGVDMACSSLRNEDCNLAIAVGVNLLIHPFALGRNSLEGVLATDGRCKTFDADADGFGRAEGVGVLLLKRFGDAVADGDRIWGVIRGNAVVQEGISKSMGTPTVEVEARAMELALQRANVNPNEVDFLETHGTGTPVGDPIEVAAIARVYSSSKRDKPLILGSVKTNIGHTESVSGIAGIQKTLLALHYGVIPRHLNLKKLNPDIMDLDTIPAQIPLNHVEWKKGPGKLRIAGVNSFGITGAQAHFVIQETPDSFPNPVVWSAKDQRDARILTFSAKTEQALQAQVEAYSTLLENLKDENDDLDSIEYTMHTGRPHLNIRCAIVATGKEQLLTQMKESIKGKSVPNMVPKICFLFPGQGSQYPGMGRELYCTSALFKSHFDWCDSILRKEHGLDIKKAIWGNENLLKSTLYGQVSIFVLEYCLLNLWESWGLKPDVVLGHSLGEFAAAIAAGILTLQEALRIVVIRSKLANTLPMGNMLVVAANLKKVEDLISKSNVRLDIAAVNSGEQVVVAGPQEGVKQFKLFCDNNAVKTTVLDASHAFHSRLMEPMLPEYSKALKAMDFLREPKKMKCTFVSSVDGKVMEDSSFFDSTYLLRHTRDKVRFLDASVATINTGATLFLEIGPHPILSPFIMMNVDEVDGVMDDLVCLPSLRRNSGDWERLLTTLGRIYGFGVPINWNNFHLYSKGRNNKVDVPGYVFDSTQKYWMSIEDDGTIPFHPLVGSRFPNASDSHIFYSKILVHNVQFLKDHMLGDKIIFPCAGYVEMCLAALRAATDSSSSSPFGIKDFQIMTPVCLNETTAIDFQVVVTKCTEGGGELCATIYTKMVLEEGEHKWIANASAKFLQDPQKPNKETLNLEKLKGRCGEIFQTSFDYKRLRDYGFNFGPSLQVLEEGWKSKKGEDEVLVKFQSKETMDSLERFFVHPWITDPMLQAQMVCFGLGQDQEDEGKAANKNLVVPIQMETFIWWGECIPQSGYIYATKANGYNEAHLFDPEGRLVLSMHGAEFMETTLGNIMALIESQMNPYPTMAEIVWKEQLGVDQRRVTEEDLFSLSFDEYIKDAKEIQTFSEVEATSHKVFYDLSTLTILRAFAELGMDKYPKEFSWPKVANDLGVIPPHFKFFRQMIMELVNDGWFTQEGENNFRVENRLLTKDEVDVKEGKLLREARVLEDYDLVERLIFPLWKATSQILTGKLSALPYLFPEGANQMGAAEYGYACSLHAKKINGVLSKVGEMLGDLGRKNKKGVLRVLEVGAGVGGGTSVLIEHMKQAGPHNYEYTYTDISPFFLQRGKQIFQDTGIPAKFALLNLEMDPMRQGFVPYSYDVIVAHLVVHATRDIEESVTHMRKLLRPGGCISFQELVKPNRTVNMIYGGTDGFWRFEDEGLRKWNCELPVDKWKAVLERSGFIDFTACHVYDNSSAIIMAKAGNQASPEVSLTTPGNEGFLIFGNEECKVTTQLVDKLRKELGYTVVLVTRKNVAVTSEKVRELLDSHLKTEATINIIGIIYLWGLEKPAELRRICEPFLYICKYLHKFNQHLNMLVVAQGSIATVDGDPSLTNLECAPLEGMLSVLANESLDIKCRYVDINPLEEGIASILGELFTFPTDDEVTVAYRGAGQRMVPRMQLYKPKTAAVRIPKSPRFHLILPASHAISDLYFAPYEVEIVPQGYVEIEIRAYSLNFRDVLIVTKPDPVFESLNSLGMDIAGVITGLGPNCPEDFKIGQRVVGCRRSGTAMPSHVLMPAEQVFPLSDDFTFVEGSTLPVAATTVVTCLFNVTQVTKDDIVLIHTASGGVGLVAIDILKQHVGCTIIVTAGNEKKRSYLSSLGLRYVYNSRNTQFAEQIRKDLGGRGVTIVLNSITGKGFKEASLSLCEPGARFIEISKMNIWTEEEVREIRPDVFYKAVDVSILSQEELKKPLDYVKFLIEGGDEGKGKLRPLPSTVFHCSEIFEALEYMEKVKHIGKISIVMPTHTSSGEPPESPLFNKEGTYLITGGLGGIGFEVAKWMALKGAGKLLLLGRNPPKPEMREKLEKFRLQGSEIIVKQGSVGCYDDIQKIFKNNPSIRGIMHAAGMLDDDQYEHQTWERFENLFESKVRGAWNLHKLSLTLPQPLEHFVLFSSLAATLGAPAQSNYVAGNCYLDALAHFRVSQGLCGLTINWGQWAEVGLAAKLVSPMYRPFSITKGIASLEHAIKTHKTQLAAFEANLPAIREALASTRGLLKDVEQALSNRGSLEVDGDKFWSGYDSAENPEKRYLVVRDFIHRVLRVTLKLSATEEIDDHANLQNMGVDSLMMVEIKNAFQSTMKRRVKISLNALKDCNTVHLLTVRLVELISGKEELPPLSPEALRKLIEKDWQLPEDIRISEELKSTLVPIQYVSVALVTGGTGSLGPYIVRELARRPKIKKVYCIMRPNPMIGLLDRFRPIYNEKGLWTKEVADKVQLIAGDVSKPNFSMEEDVYGKLVSEVDAVFNIAATVAFRHRYRDGDDPGNPRTTNLFGTQQVLKFSSTGKLKHLFHASTLLAASQVDEQQDRLSESWPDIEEAFVLPPAAYIISKLVGDGLVAQAVELGIPAKVFRFPYVGPDSESGKNMDYQTFLMMRLFGYMYMKFMPALKVPINMLPVDLCAKRSVELFFKPEAGYEVYNISNPQTADEGEFDEIAEKFGIMLDILEPEEAKERLKNVESADEWSQHFEKVVQEYEADARTYEDMETPMYISWLRGNKALFKSEKVEKLLGPWDVKSSEDIIYDALAEAKRSGVFDRYKINYN